MQGAQIQWVKWRSLMQSQVKPLGRRCTGKRWTDFTPPPPLKLWIPLYWNLRNIFRMIKIACLTLIYLVISVIDKVIGVCPPKWNSRLELMHHINWIIFLNPFSLSVDLFQALARNPELGGPQSLFHNGKFAGPRSQSIFMLEFNFEIFCSANSNQ